MGDALLCIRNRYHGLVRERLKRYRNGEAGALSLEFSGRYEEAVDFKLDPVLRPLGWDALRESNEALCALWARVFLEVESRRLGADFESLAAYARYGGRLMPAFPRTRSWLIALRDRMRRGANLRPVSEYPRCALWRALACLLGGNAVEAGNYLPNVGDSPFEPESWLTVYETWWRRYS